MIEETANARVSPCWRPVHGAIGLSPIHSWSGGGRAARSEPKFANNRGLAGAVSPH